MFQSSFGVSGYTFGDGYFEVPPGAFSSIPAGTRINLSGVTTDGMGTFSAVVPK